MLHHASEKTLSAMANDQDLRRRVEQLVLGRREIARATTWFQNDSFRIRRSAAVAYFSMEFGLSEALPNLLRRPGQCRGRSA